VFILANSRLPCGIFIYYNGTVVISFNYQEVVMAQSGFFDQISNVSVGPVSNEVIARVRRSCEGNNTRGEVIFSYVLRDDERFDCTYPEWIQRHQATTLGRRVRDMISHMGSDLGMQFVPWTAVESVAAGLLGDGMSRDFLASLCQEMRNQADDQAHKDAWKAKQATYRPLSVAEQE
jgi:hypothetical protein